MRLANQAKLRWWLKDLWWCQIKENWRQDNQPGNFWANRRLYCRNNEEKVYYDASEYLKDCPRKLVKKSLENSTRNSTTKWVKSACNDAESVFFWWENRHSNYPAFRKVPTTIRSAWYRSKICTRYQEKGSSKSKNRTFLKPQMRWLIVKLIQSWNPGR